MTASSAVMQTENAGAAGNRVASGEWASIAAGRPQLAATAARYLTQIGLSLRPASVAVADNALRQLCSYLIVEAPQVSGFRDVRRAEIEAFKLHLARRPGRLSTVSANTLRQRLGTLRTFFDRIGEWDWDDAPPRTPIYSIDLPVVDDPLPRFLDDAQAARLLRAASADPKPLRRLIVHLLARTGLRVGELCALPRDAMARIDEGWWLRVPVGKLHNDRYVPLHPQLVEMLQDWLATTSDAGTGLLLVRANGTPLNRYAVSRILDRVAAAAGVGHVHPHQLRHTLATQAINRGMRIEAIAAMLGHRTLRMTLVYARIANRTVADQYHSVSQAVDALYDDPDLPGRETTAMRRLREEHRRMLGNGWCTRPANLDCAFETICEGCGFFTPTIEFRPTLERQRDHAASHDQPGRADLYQHLIDRVDNTA
jgi:site-specific recombinase XerD